MINLNPPYDMRQSLLFFLAFSMRSSAKLRPQVGQAERSSRGFDANSDLRLGAEEAAEDAGGCNETKRLSIVKVGLQGWPKRWTPGSVNMR